LIKISNTANTAKLETKTNKQLPEPPIKSKMSRLNKGNPKTTVDTRTKRPQIRSIKIEN